MKIPGTEYDRLLYTGDCWRKFGQNDELKKLLLETGDSVLAECAVKDRIWGIGLSMINPDRMDRACWKGQNLLGYALMMVREDLAMS